MNSIIAVDIGGTEIKYGLVSRTGNILMKDSLPTEAWLGGEALMVKVRGIIEKMQETSLGKSLAIGISTGGQVDIENGIIRFATDNVPGWSGMKVKEILQEKFELPVHVENDVNAAALGEAWLGAGRGISNFVMITLGTGIGGAIIKDGQLYYGIKGSAGEFGHMKIYFKGLPCTCGMSGCFEQYGSTSALIKMVKQGLDSGIPSVLRHVDEINGKSIFAAQEQGDKLAQQSIETWIDHIAWGISIIVHSLNPGAVLIGGGVSREGEKLIGQIREKLYKMIMPSFKDGFTLQAASLSNDAGIIGAAYGALLKLKEVV